jgi:hypothetical protein
MHDPATIKEIDLPIFRHLATEQVEQPKKPQGESRLQKISEQLNLNLKKCIAAIYGTNTLVDRNFTESLQKKLTQTPEC